MHKPRTIQISLLAASLTLAVPFATLGQDTTPSAEAAPAPTAMVK